MKKILALGLSAVIALSGVAFNPAPADAYTDSSLGARLIGKIGNSTKTVYKGNEFELEVRKGSKVRDNDIKWSIGNTAIVKFDDDDRTDDEIELRAVKAGTTKVTAKNLLTGGKITYTVTVKNPSYTISRVGTKERTARVGDYFELEVRKNGGIKDKDLYWTTSNKNIVKVVDDDRTDDEIELKAVGKGTATITCKNNVTGGKITYKVTVKSATGLIYRVGSETKTVRVGDDLDLEVRKSGLKDSQIKWSIADTSILRFDDGESVGDDVEVIARKAGTTKVTAKNLLTGGKIVYTVKVVK